MVVCLKFFGKCSLIIKVTIIDNFSYTHNAKMGIGAEIFIIFQQDELDRRKFHDGNIRLQIYCPRER